MRHIPPPKKLERVIDQEQEQIVLELRERNANLAINVLEKEGKALSALYKEMVLTGVPPEVAPTIICLKMANDAGKIQKALASRSLRRQWRHFCGGQSFPTLLHAFCAPSPQIP